MCSYSIPIILISTTLDRAVFCVELACGLCRSTPCARNLIMEHLAGPVAECTSGCFKWKCLPPMVLMDSPASRRGSATLGGQRRGARRQTRAAGNTRSTRRPGTFSGPWMGPPGSSTLGQGTWRFASAVLPWHVLRHRAYVWYSPDDKLHSAGRDDAVAARLNAAVEAAV